MNPLGTTGSGRAFMGGSVVDVRWAPGRDRGDGTMVTLADGREIEITDHDDRFGYAYTPSDDGRVLYNAMVVLESGEADPVGVPTADELRATAHAAMQPLYEGVTDGSVDADDIPFCLNIFTKPECLLRSWQRHGGTDAARVAILADTWNI